MVLDIVSSKKNKRFRNPTNLANLGNWGNYIIYGFVQVYTNINSIKVMFDAP